MIKASLEEIGGFRSIAVDGEGIVRAGNGVFEQAKALGMSIRVVDAAPGELIAVRRQDLLGDKAIRAALMDNRASETSEWDDEVLRGLVAEDAKLLEGVFDAAELERFVHKPMTDEVAEARVDAAEELQKKWKVERGQIWTIKGHRLMCGDSTSADDLARLMCGERAQLLFTSPPYADRRDYKESGVDWEKLMEGVSGAAIDVMAPDSSMLFNLGLVHTDGKVFRYWDPWINWMEAQGQLLYGWYVWDKLSALMGDWRGRLAPTHEFIFHFASSPRRANKTTATKYAERGETHYKVSQVGLREKDGSIKGFQSAGRKVNQTKVIDSVVRVQPARGGVAGHPAPFSVAFAETLVEVYAHRGELVYEPFSGSGTTIIAADRLGRRCNGMEIAPQYCAVTLERLLTTFGTPPTLESDGKAKDPKPKRARA